MNGADIISREIGEDIDALDSSKPGHKDCEFARAAKPAIKRSLRVAESCFKMQKVNTALFIAIFASSFRIDNISIVDWIIKLIMKSVGL